MSKSNIFLLTGPMKKITHVYASHDKFLFTFFDISENKKRNLKSEQYFLQVSATYIIGTLSLGHFVHCHPALNTWIKKYNTVTNCDFVRYKVIFVFFARTEDTSFENGRGGDFICFPHVNFLRTPAGLKKQLCNAPK